MLEFAVTNRRPSLGMLSRDTVALRLDALWSVLDDLTNLHL